MRASPDKKHLPKPASTDRANGMTKALHTVLIKFMIGKCPTGQQ
jgi:hypothetical protein